MAFNFFKKAALSVTASTLLLAGMMSGAQAYEKGKEYNYIILHVNDTHGHFWADNRGQGGFPAIATIVKQVKTANPDKAVLVLHSGDVFTGVPESDMQKAEPDVVGMNAIGFDAWAVGNHEFDLPFDEMVRITKMSKTPLISANIDYTDPVSKSTKPYFEPYVFFERGGLKYLIVGTTTPSTKYQANPKHTERFTFTDPTKAFTTAVADSEKKNGKADVVISLSHLGYYAQGKHGANPYGDTILARNLPKGLVSAFITGHTHVPGCVKEDGTQAWPEPGEKCVVPYENGAPLMQAYKWGYYVGKADFTFKDGVAKMTDYQLIPVNLKKRVVDYTGKRAYIDAWAPVKEDEEVKKILKPYQDKGNETLMVKVGELKQDLKTSRQKISKLAYLAAEAERVISHADIAILNSGGIREDLQAGDISYRDILTVQPFANTITTVDFTKDELIDYLSVVAFKTNGGFPAYAGISFDIDAKTKAITNLTVGGKAIEDGKKYKLAVLSFLASGGDGYPPIVSHPTFVDTGYNDANAFVEYFKTHKVIDPKDVVIEGPNWKNKD